MPVNLFYGPAEDCKKRLELVRELKYRRVLYIGMN